MQAGVTGQFDEMVQNTKMYKKPLTKMQGMMIEELKKAKPADIFAKTFIKAVNCKKPKKCYKTNNSFKMKMLSLLPSSVQDWAFYQFLK